MFINILIIIVLMVLTAFNIFYMFYFKRRSFESREVDYLDNYFKLDGKIELQKYLAFGLIAIAGLFGYNKISDINTELSKIESISTQYETLQSHYDDIVRDYSELEEQLESIEASIDQADKRVSDYRLSIYKIERDLQDASQRIPEQNLRNLAEILVRAHVKSVTRSYKYIDEEYTKDEVRDEINKSKEILRNLGYTEEEISALLDGFKL